MQDEEEVYIIALPAGADAFEVVKSSSNESPIGRALIGKKTGDTATIATPVGMMSKS